MPPPTSPHTKAARAGRTRALELRRSLADEVRRYREDAGLSQARLAEAAGVSQSVVSDLEAARRDPGVEVLARLGAALGGRLTVRIDPGTGPLVRDQRSWASVDALWRYQSTASLS